jgi:hypothetical protein
MEDKKKPDQSKDQKLKIQSSDSFHNLEFELSESQREALIECVKKTGKISLRLNPKNISRLPGRGLLDDVDGELID